MLTAVCKVKIRHVRSVGYTSRLLPVVVDLRTGFPHPSRANVPDSLRQNTPTRSRSPKTIPVHGPLLGGFL